MLTALPILVPLSTAVVALLAARSPRVQQAIALAGAAGLLVAAVFLLARVERHGIQVLSMGGWPSPVAIPLVADTLAAVMVLVTAVITAAVSVYAAFSMSADARTNPFWPVFHVMVAGVCQAFLAGDLFNLFVAFEVMLVASFVLLALGGSRAQLSGSIQYVSLNMIASLLFLMAVGILYAATGTLNMADIGAKLADLPDPTAARGAAVLLVAAFGIKAAVFPLFFWLPASYHTPSPAVSALFAAMLTKVGVYALIRTFTVVLDGDAGFARGMLLGIAGATMLTGVLGAMAQHELRKLLAFHIVSQIGYMILGLAVGTPAAIAAAIFYVVHNILAKTNLFLVAGAIGRIRGTERLEGLGGLYRSHPWLSLLFLVPALALAGVPPLSGFFAKLFVVREAFAAGRFALGALALVVGLLTLYSMNKIWLNVFWKPAPEGTRSAPAPLVAGYRGMLVPIAALATLTALVGLVPSALWSLSEHAASQLADPITYRNAVLGTGTSAVAVPEEPPP